MSHATQIPIWILVIPYFVVLPCFSQQNPTDETAWEVVDVYPEFPDGMKAFYDYVGRNLVYPQEAEKNNIEGKVFIGFVVNSDGSIRPGSTKVLKGIGYGCDEEAARIIRESPRWIPGRMKDPDRNIPVLMVLPFRFRL